MQAWSDEGVAMLVSVESTDKCTRSVACSHEKFRKVEASLYQVLHRTQANEVRIVEQT